ncbi:MAG: esterase [Alphaproteobacteria bacterium]|nr:MAG: esterase [Alphaproteobacteria bacterium]
MIWNIIKDWDDAYANMPNIPGGEAWPESWARDAAGFRQAIAADGRMEAGIAYGPGERNTFDLFLPQGRPRGLFVFVHGGYWMRFDPSFFSHFAAGPLARGLAVAMPRYSLCPQVRVSDITAEVGRAIAAAAARVDGPVVLAGHSAGGHLVARMVTRTSPLPAPLLERVRTTVSISGVHDLRPLLRLQLNETFRLDHAEAAAESPALLEPAGAGRLICWVGAGERSEFVRQNALLANIWRGLDLVTACVEEPDRHHFNVIDGLRQPDSPLTRAAVDDLI